MKRFRMDLRGGAFRNVLAFTVRHWSRQPARLAIIITTVLICTLADVLTPFYSGQLVDAVAKGAATEVIAWHAALAVLSMLIALALGAIVMRHVAFIRIADLTLQMMSDISIDAFHRVQRFSTDWHTKGFSGSTVRMITRGARALDILNDMILMASLSSLSMLTGSAVLLGWYWPITGLIIACGSLVYIALTITLSLGYVAPSASLANSWDTRLGGALADAINCNAVVKDFGAEQREDERLAKVIAKVATPDAPDLMRGTINGTTQGTTLLAPRAAVIGYALLLWSGGQATPGDVAFVLTSCSVLQGYLRDVGTHGRNVQRSAMIWRSWSISKASRSASLIAQKPSRSGSRKAASISRTFISTMVAMGCRSTKTFRFRLRPANRSVWSVRPAPARPPL